MFELEFSIFELELKLRIETALATLSIPHIFQMLKHLKWSLLVYSKFKKRKICIQ